MEDLRWMGLEWNGEPIFQSQRRPLYFEAWRRLKEAGLIYPCSRSRREMSALAPHEEEPIFPVEWRADTSAANSFREPAGVNWRFRVPDGESISFKDQNFGPIEKTTLRDFGDFLVWNRDDIPAYELAVVVDDIAMGVTEVVRGADLLTSTARQILLYRALEASPPAWFHCPLVCDAEGRRLRRGVNGICALALPSRDDDFSGGPCAALRRAADGLALFSPGRPPDTLTVPFSSRIESQSGSPSRYAMNFDLRTRAMPPTRARPIALMTS
jgi:glutamyl-tRNA synthetase